MPIRRALLTATVVERLSVKSRFTLTSIIEGRVALGCADSIWHNPASAVVANANAANTISILVSTALSTVIVRFN